MLELGFSESVTFALNSYVLLASLTLKCETHAYWSYPARVTTGHGREPRNGTHTEVQVLLGNHVPQTGANGDASNPYIGTASQILLSRFYRRRNKILFLFAQGHSASEGQRWAWTTGPWVSTACHHVIKSKERETAGTGN